MELDLLRWEELNLLRWVAQGKYWEMAAVVELMVA